MSIDLNSPEALFGKILEQLKSGNDRFDVIDHRFDALNLRFDGIDQKLVALQDCLQKTGRQVGSVELTTVTKDEHQKDLEEVHNRIDSLDMSRAKLLGFAVGIAISSGGIAGGLIKFLG